jgi:uncharacterized protein DUF4158
MAFKERLSILIDSEIKDFYGVPNYSIDEQRFYFALNDLEFKTVNLIHSRLHRCFFVVLLGYFKTKPVVLSPNYGEVEQDLKFVANELYSKLGIRRFSLTQRQKDRFYLKIFDLLDYQVLATEQRQTQTANHLQVVSQTCIEPRYLFDACIEYLSQHRIAIPKYTILQQLVSQAIHHEKARITKTLKVNISTNLASELGDLVDGSNLLTMRKLQQSAKSFNVSELEKELKVYRLIHPWMEDVNKALSALYLSVKNQQHFASMVDYYSLTKLKRFDRLTQQLYLSCYLQERSQQNIERLADGFIYHVRKLRAKAMSYAKETAYKDWEGAASNVSKAAELLHLFIDDSIDDQQSFAQVKRQAQKLLKSRDIESLCLYLKKQKRVHHDYVWEFYDQQKETIQRLLRPIFLCLTFESSDNTEALTAQPSK